jgi:hypothetical protein
MIVGGYVVAVREAIDEGRVSGIADNLTRPVILHHDEVDVVGLIVIGGESG